MVDILHSVFIFIQIEIVLTSLVKLVFNTLYGFEGYLDHRFMRVFSEGHGIIVQFNQGRCDGDVKLIEFRLLF